MAKLEQFIQLTSRQRRTRYFSEEFKRRKVEEIDQNMCSIADICKEYQVSKTAVYNWIYKYSIMRKKGEKQVYESLSDTKKLKQLHERVQELERIIGQKQLQIDFRDKVIELAEKTYKVDIKKKFGEKASTGTGSTENSTDTK